jgi:ABC-type amino acid transport substrate-binding protein
MNRLSCRLGTIAALALSFALTGVAAVRTTLRCGWYAWPPYQYAETRQDIEVLTGLDVQLVRGIFSRSGYTVVYQPVPWDQHQANLQNGILDIAAGATFTPERKVYAFFRNPIGSNGMCCMSARMTCPDTRSPPFRPCCGRSVPDRSGSVSWLDSPTPHPIFGSF